MEIGFVGLGRMGRGMVARLLKGKHRVVVWNRSQGPVREMVRKGAVSSKSIEEMISKLKSKTRIVWVMLPAGNVTDSFVQGLSEMLNKGDIIIDGGNSNFHSTISKHKELAKKGIHFVDIGTSSGLAGEKKGYCMMVGGNKKVFSYLKPILSSLCAEKGFEYMGESGSGHYVKMIHNSIEYGMMQSIAEGFNLLKNGSFKNLNMEKIASVWNHGSIIDSYLMQMVENSFKSYGNLNDLKPYVEDSGEGRWAALEAIEQKVPYVANTYALNARYSSRKRSSFAMKLLAAIRNQFGGHRVKKR